MDPSIPTIIASLVPMVATSLSALFITDRLSPKQNALIALAAILIVSVVCELLTMTSETGNKAAWFLGTLAYVAVFMKGDLGILYQSLLSVNSTSSEPPANPNPVRVPTALVMPKVPPRASAQPPDA